MQYDINKTIQINNNVLILSLDIITGNNTPKTENIKPHIINPTDNLLIKQHIIFHLEHSRKE